MANVNDELDSLKARLFATANPSVPSDAPGNLAALKGRMAGKSRSKSKMTAIPAHLQDLAEELRDNGAKINADGSVTVYHYTTPEAKKAIESTGKMVGKEDGLFFTTNSNGQAQGYGPAAVKMNIPLSQILLDDVFGNEAHVRIPTRGIGQAVDVSPYLSQDD